MHSQLLLPCLKRTLKGDVNEKDGLSMADGHYSRQSLKGLEASSIELMYFFLIMMQTASYGQPNHLSNDQKACAGG